jgi:hypothetical protein
MSSYLLKPILMAKQSKRTGPPRVRLDGRKSFLVYLRTEVIKDLKVAALREDRYAYLITEDAIRSYLTGKRSLRKGRP